MGDAAISNLEAGHRGTKVTVRSSVTTNDAAVPDASQGTLDGSNFRYLIVECIITGTTPTFDVTPLYWNETAVKYNLGEKRTISNNSVFLLNTLNYSNIYFLCDGSTGTSPNITIYATPYSY